MLNRSVLGSSDYVEVETENIMANLNELVKQFEILGAQTGETDGIRWAHNRTRGVRFWFMGDNVRDNVRVTIGAADRHVLDNAVHLDLSGLGPRTAMGLINRFEWLRTSERI